MQFRSAYFFPVILLGFLGCTTSPEFNRDHIYDYNAWTEGLDSTDIASLPPPTTEYEFVHAGLKLKIPHAIRHQVRILRRNGAQDFEEILKDSLYKQGHDYFDTTIKSLDNIGFPLIYKVICKPSKSQPEFTKTYKIDFGELVITAVEENQNNFYIEWEDTITLKDGIHVLKIVDSDTLDFADITTGNSLTIPYTPENLLATYKIKPYKIFHGRPTFLEGDEFTIAPNTSDIQKTNPF